MRSIWKFKVDPEKPVEMPAGARLLSVAFQGDDLCVWAEVDPDAPKVQRRFTVVGTGHDLPSAPGEFVGTAHTDGIAGIFGFGALVFHVYDQGEVAA